jgi:hypothetical protein
MKMGFEFLVDTEDILIGLGQGHCSKIAAKYLALKVMFHSLCYQFMVGNSPDLQCRAGGLVCLTALVALSISVMNCLPVRF